VEPEACYVVYPCNVPNALARLDLGGQAMTAGVDQLPGVCRDYFTVQHWLDFSNGELGMTVALPENPMVQLGDFHFGHNQAEFRLERAMLLGWISNNYWETNFRAHQPGRVYARYCLLPHAGSFDETEAHRFGWEMANSRLLLQHMGEERASRPPLLPAIPSPRTRGSAGTSLLRLPGSGNEPSPVLTLHVKPTADQRGAVVRLLNASDEEQPAEIGSGLLRIVSAQVCDIVEAPLSAAEVSEGTVRLRVPARRVATVQLSVE
jgi:alpha-mannosidase